MCFTNVGLYTDMELKNLFIFLQNLSEKLNVFHNRKSNTNLIVKNKSNNKAVYNPVTNYDRSFEKLIRSIIQKSFPKDAITGEELKDKKSSNNFQWVIDPIDGTKAFVIGLPTWSNLIGLSYKKKPIIGLANFPKLKRFYLNDNKRSFLFKNQKKYIIKSSKNYDLKHVKIIGNFYRNLNTKKKDKLINKFGSSYKHFSFDALNYCLLAEGKVDVVVESSLKNYDIVPLIPIIKNSGGLVTNWKNGPAENGGNILATSNIKLHKKMIKLLNRL